MNKAISVYFPLILVCYEAVIYLANDMYLPALPTLWQTFQINDVQAQYVLAAWFYGAVTAQLVLGPLSDRFGRRPVLLGGGMVFVLGTVLCASATVFPVLLCGRFLQGVAIASLAVGYAVIHELFNHRQAINTLAWMTGVVVLAPAFGPLLGGVVLLFTSWRMIFYGLALCGAVLWWCLWYIMPETRPQPLVPLSVRQLWRDHLGVLCNRSFMINTVAASLFIAVFIAWLAEGPFLVVNFLHKTPLQFGIYQVWLFSSYILGTLAVRYCSVIPLRYVMHAVLSLMLGGGLLAVLLSYCMSDHFLGFFIGFLVFSFGTGLSFPLFNRLAIAACVEPMGIRVAIFSLMLNLFALLACYLVRLCASNSVTDFALLMAGLATVGCLGKWWVPHAQIDLDDAAIPLAHE